MVNDMALLKVVDVESVTFPRGLRGYDVNEVDEFLDRVADTLLHYAEQHTADQMRIRDLEEKLKENDTFKASLQDTLDMAKRTKDEYLSSSQKECDAVLAEARAKAEAIVADAVRQKTQVLRELEDLRRSEENFIADARAIVVRYNMLLDGIQERKNICPGSPLGSTTL